MQIRLSSNINESAVLLECFKWDDEYDIERVKEELKDVLVYCRNMLDKLELDEDEIVNQKMEQNEKKYPMKKSKGKVGEVRLFYKLII